MDGLSIVDLVEDLACPNVTQVDNFVASGHDKDLLFSSLVLDIHYDDIGLGAS